MLKLIEGTLTEFFLNFTVSRLDACKSSVISIAFLLLEFAIRLLEGNIKVLNIKSFYYFPRELSALNLIFLKPPVQVIGVLKDIFGIFVLFNHPSIGFPIFGLEVWVLYGSTLFWLVNMFLLFRPFLPSYLIELRTLSWERVLFIYII